MSRRAAAAAFALAAAAGVWMSAAVAGGGPILARRWGLLGMLALWTAVWVAGVAAAFRLPRRAAVAAVLVAGVALRLAALAGPPTLSDDLYRYSWDGRVQAAGIDPYRYTPRDRALAHLREPWLWPDAAGCEQLHRPEGCSRINRSPSRTIYPPVAQVWFAAVYRAGGIEARHKLWQVAGLGVDLVVLALLPLLLRAWRTDQRWSALYALSPFPVIEVVNNGHVDGLALLLGALALLAAARRRPGWAGALVGAAALVKIYPLVLLGALVAVGRRQAGSGGRLRPLASASVAAAAVAVVGYLPHVVAVGWRVLGYLPGYLAEEGYDGERYLLAGLLGLPPPVTAAVAAAGLGGVAAWVLRHRPLPPRAAAALVGGLLLAATPVQPWYGVLLLGVAAVGGRPAWAVVVAAGYPYFFAVILDGPAPAVGRLSYGLALAVVAGAALVRRRADRPGGRDRLSPWSRPDRSGPAPRVAAGS